jgi:hypothetical protein
MSKELSAAINASFLIFFYGKRKVAKENGRQIIGASEIDVNERQLLAK